MKIYATLGQIHSHIVGGVYYNKDSVVEIESESESEARELLRDVFGNYYATTYLEKPDMKYFRRGLFTLSVTETERAELKEFWGNVSLLKSKGFTVEVSANKYFERIIRVEFFKVLYSRNCIGCKDGVLYVPNPQKPLQEIVRELDVLALNVEKTEFIALRIKDIREFVKRVSK